jgi:regulator of PEP synthase PpsR (kinase-PPPase family)
MITETKIPPVFIISGGMGASGEQLVRTALAQFQDVGVPVIIIPKVNDTAQLEDAVNQAAKAGGAIVHTLVDVNLRRQLIRLARDRNVTAIDPIGRLLSHLAAALGREPAGQPGLYRQLRQNYFDRVEAIEYAVAHDDGKNPEGWSKAEIVLVGVSRVGKTPLSMYLSVRGWKAANVPLVSEIPPPPELFMVDPRRVVGLMISPSQLVDHRKKRQRRLGVVRHGTYTNPVDLYDEVEAARKLFRRHGFAVIDVTDKPIEESADEVISLMLRRLAP